MIKFLYLLLTLLILLLGSGLRAQGDTIRPGKGGLTTRNLQPGIRYKILMPALTPDVRTGFRR